MAIAGFALPADWGWLPVAFSAGLIWRPAPPPPVQILCPDSTGGVCPASRGFGVFALLLAFLLGLAVGRLWGFLASSGPRLRRAARAPPQPLFG